ncbi:MAG: hypothetical protein JSU70_01095 [Phycisphaerales bacterium]|nr:MAG: hypothetical protein JSU70_01095 [Phycisphaerales bacterium]
MLKKSLVALAVVAIMATSLQAGHVKKYDWPGHWVWDCVEITRIPVYMKIGMYIEILDQDKLEIIMKQDAWREYSGCVTIKIKTNFKAELSCSFNNQGAPPGEYSCKIEGGACVEPTLSDTVAERKVCVYGKKVHIVHAAPNNKLKIGEAVVCVKPCT